MPGYFGTEEQFNVIIDKLNEIDEDIQFTSEFGDNNGKSLKILNLQLFVTDNGIKRMICDKPTNNHVLLHPKSNNPKITFETIIRGFATHLSLKVHMAILKFLTCSIFIDLKIHELETPGKKVQCFHSIDNSVRPKRVNFHKKKKYDIISKVIS